MFHHSLLFGLAVGDALGVPVEFRDRAYLRQHPVTEMFGFGTHRQPPGTWSDDASLAFCLAEAICSGLTPDVLARNFINWLDKGWWTPHGRVFDIGNGTHAALRLLKEGIDPELAGGMDEDSNGNGSLMRILPLVIGIKDLPVEERYRLTKMVSSLTHAHVRSVIACFYYLEFARLLLRDRNKHEAYAELQSAVPAFLHQLDINPGEIALFDRLLKGEIAAIPEEKIFSSGYVLHTLEASIWCLMTTDTYPAAVLRAVNLGGDTDTTGAVTGGLAGILYGYDSIPHDWINTLARKPDIEHLAARLAKLQFK